MLGLLLLFNEEGVVVPRQMPHTPRLLPLITTPNGDDDETTCTICLETTSINNTPHMEWVTAEGCALHRFHSNCIRGWNRGTCPVCRARLVWIIVIIVVLLLLLSAWPQVDSCSILQYQDGRCPKLIVWLQEPGSTDQLQENACLLDRTHSPIHTSSIQCQDGCRPALLVLWPTPEWTAWRRGGSFCFGWCCCCSVVVVEHRMPCPCCAQFLLLMLLLLLLLW